MARLLANGAGQASVSFAIAWLIRRTLGEIEAASVDHLPMITVAALVAAGLLLCALRSLERADAERVGQDYVVKVRLRLFARLATMPPRCSGQSRTT